MRVYYQTFGCKVNSFETAAMAQTLAEAGFSACGELAKADIVIVNSCTVTAGGDRKLRAFLRRAKRENPGVVSVLTGCLPQAFPEDASALDIADIVTGNKDRSRIADHIFSFLENNARIVDIGAHVRGETFEYIGIDRMEGHTRAFMKIEDGCDRYCSYCIVPYARGHIRSLDPEAVTAQAARFADAGYKEIVLSGINLSSYGSDIGKTLADAVDAAATPDGILRVRLSSLDPDRLPESLIARLAENNKLCPQFHLSLQSGCDKTLHAMGRPYTAADFSAVAGRLSAAFDSPTFTTDVMTGFPGETEADFLESLAFVRGFGFLKCHVFPYSPRPGTPAAALPLLPRKEREARARRMIAAADEVRAEILKRQIGKTVHVILEQPDESGDYSGFDDRYIPVLVKGTKGMRSGDIVTADITSADGERCVASPQEG